MRPAPWLAALTALAGLASAAPAQTTLRWKLDEPFYVESVATTDTVTKVGEQDVKQKQSLKMLFALKVLRAEREQTVVRMTIESIEVKQEGAVAGGEEIMQKLKGASVRLTFDPRWNLTKLEGVDEAVDKMIAGLPGGGAGAEGAVAFLRSAIDGMFRSQASEIFVPMPDGPVNPGDAWKQNLRLTLSGIGRFTLRKTLTYQGPATDNRSVHRIKTTGEAEFKPDDAGGGLPFKIKEMKVRSSEYTGTLRFDAKAGRPVRSDVKVVTDLDMTMEVNDQTIKARVDGTQTYSFRFLDRKPGGEQ